MNHHVAQKCNSRLMLFLESPIHVLSQSWLNNFEISGLGHGRTEVEFYSSDDGQVRLIKESVLFTQDAQSKGDLIVQTLATLSILRLFGLSGVQMDQEIIRFLEANLLPCKTADKPSFETIFKTEPFPLENDKLDPQALKELSRKEFIIIDKKMVMGEKTTAVKSLIRCLDTLNNLENFYGPSVPVLFISSDETHPAITPDSVRLPVVFSSAGTKVMIYV